MKEVFFHEFSNPAGAPRLHTASVAPRDDTRTRLTAKDNASSALAVRSRPVMISRRRKEEAYLVDQSHNHGFEQNEQSDHKTGEWATFMVPGPDLTDKATVVNLAKMCSDAYTLSPSQPGWLNDTLGFNRSASFGWEGQGLRGHTFTDKTNTTVIVAFKGTTVGKARADLCASNTLTSIALTDRGKNKDRTNDNLLFSCCCATQRPDPFWYGRVCDCRTGNFQCNSTCLTQELLRQDRYYSTALAVMRNVSIWYPNANIWTVGHSLGGSISSLIGLTFNIPSVSFEAPPQKLAAERLGLDIPPHSADSHIGNTADPVYMGACNGYFSTCSIAGFAFESQCHTGKRCVYDTVQDMGWHVSITNHRINTVIDQVLEVYNTTPACEADDECVDCFNWKFDSQTY